MAKSKDPFAVDWSKANIDETAFTQWLRTELQNALDARASWVAEGGWIDLAHLLYEQDQMDRQGPWPNSANLTSWIAMVQVDSLTSRIAQAICGVEPLCTARGWGATPMQTAKVESIMEWQAQDQFLRDHLEDAIELALIEGTSMLEVDERSVMRHTRREIRVVQQTSDLGEPLFNTDMEPMLATDPVSGDYQEWDGDESTPNVTVVVEERNYACGGPQYRVLGGKDFLILPGHARNDSEVWGYAKRFYLRPVELEQRAAAGTYHNLDRLSMGTSDRQQRADETRRGITIAPEDGQTVEKEFWEVHLCYDIDGDGADEWLIATINIVDQVMMRLEYDQIQQMRGVFFRPFPNPTWVYGRSLVINKLLTTIFEHTAERNMIADRAAMAVSAPMSRLTTAYWNPNDQPIGPQAVIDVRSHDEIKQVQIQDVPQSMIYLKRDTESAAEKIGGANDSAVVGVSPEGAPPTATQVTTTTQASYIRVDKATRRLRSSVSKVYDLLLVLTRRMLEGKGDQGMSLPDDVIRGMESRGVPIPQDGPMAVTAADLSGRWTFKPKGSVQSSDKRYLLQNFNGLMSTVAGLAKMNPQFAQNLATNPEIIKEFLGSALYIYDVPDPQKILDTLTTAPQSAGMQASPMPGQPPTAPNGMPPQLQQLLSSMTPGGQPSASPTAAPEMSINA